VVEPVHDRRIEAINARVREQSRFVEAVKAQAERARAFVGG
jgi:hypothetical protein